MMKFTSGTKKLTPKAVMLSTRHRKKKGTVGVEKVQNFPGKMKERKELRKGGAA